MIGRVLPFFAEPSFRFVFCSICEVLVSVCFVCFLIENLFIAFSSRHGVIFETIGSLLSLLRGGSREAYRQFFVDAMVVVEGI